MTRKDNTKPTGLGKRFIETLCGRIAENKQVRRALPQWGRLHVDRQLPFLCIYRKQVTKKDLGFSRLLVGQASYMLATGSKSLHGDLSEVVKNVVRTLTREFGAFLIVEIWPWEDVSAEQYPQPTSLAPNFRIVASKTGTSTLVCENLKNNLSAVRIRKKAAVVTVEKKNKIAPPRLEPIISSAEASELGCELIGIGIKPIFRNQSTGNTYPLIHRAMLRELTRSLQQTFFTFAETQTTHHPANFHSLGRRAVVKAVWEVDNVLSEIDSEFDFLLQVTPVNSDVSWREFKRRRFAKTPVFQYRPHSANYSLLKRKLWNVKIDRIEDPTLADLFSDKRRELDQRLTMLTYLASPYFIYSSMQLFGWVDDTLLQLAKEILNRTPARSRESGTGQYCDSAEFSGIASEEIAFYTQYYNKIKAKVEIRSDVTGLLVSRGNLLVNQMIKIPRSRVDALIQHEIGTHLLTYYNGCSQPFRLLSSGLAGYEELQEGIAVLAEYLAGGLSRPRLRLLAARVLAVRMLTEGASFIETFNKLNNEYGFAQSKAFKLTLRVYRGGGLTKDMIYLRGLVGLLKYISQGGDLDILFLGKFGLEHVPIIRELQLRKLLVPGPLRPRYLERPATSRLLKKLRDGRSVIDLINRR